MLVEVQSEVVLKNLEAPESNELNVSWKVLFSAYVETTRGSFDEPSLQEVKDIEIQDVVARTIHYGHSGPTFTVDYTFRATGEADVSKAWIIQQLKNCKEDRSDWIEAIKEAARATYKPKSRSRSRFSMPQKTVF